MIAFGAVIALGLQAAPLETGGPSRTGTSRCAPASPRTRRYRERNAHRALPVSLKDRICDVWPRPQKEAWSSKLRIFAMVVLHRLLVEGWLGQRRYAESLLI